VTAVFASPPTLLAAAVAADNNAAAGPTTEGATRVASAGTGLQKTENTGQRRVAIFVKNNTGRREFDRLAENFATRVRAKVSGRGYEIISDKEAVAAVAALPDAAKTADGIEFLWKRLGVQTVVNAITKNKSQKNLGGDGTTADERLLSQTSFVRLAQNLTADYVLFLSLDEYDDTEQKERIFGETSWLEKTFSLSGSYILTDYSGFSIGGDSLDAKILQRTTAGDRSNVAPLKNLPQKLADQVAKEMSANAAKWRNSSLATAKVDVEFDVLAHDQDSLPLYLPAFDPDAKEPVSFEREFPARVNAIVEVDGIAVGTTNCKVPLVRGLHKVRFQRDGHDDIHLTINVQEGLKIAPYMRMTEGEKNQLKKFRDELRAATKDATITHAKARALGDIGKALKIRAAKDEFIVVDKSVKITK
jgi:hypothetical protein